ncbi:MAG: sensor histidine kinase [Anaerolineae bacterium]
MTRPCTMDPMRPRLTPLGIAGIYALVGSVWILTSDYLLGLALPDPDLLVRLSIAKGLFYIAATTLLLYLLVRRNNAELYRSTLLLRSTIDSLADAVMIVDTRACIVAVNPAFERLVGLAQGEAVGRTLTDVYARVGLRHPDGRPVAPEEEATARALRGEALKGLEQVMRRPDGLDAVVSVSAAPVFQPGSHEIALAVAVVRDITEVRRLERLRDEFLSTAAHELKTPVTTIKGYAQLLLQSVAEHADPRERAALAVINRQSDRLTRLVQDLLEFSRLRLSALALRREVFDLRQLAVESIEEFQVMTQRHRLVLKSHAPVTVDADRDRIGQVMANLLDNAIKFSPEGGEVQVTVEERAGEAFVAVRDFGVGISPEAQPHIFERYYRAYAGTPLDARGMGMGLYLNREMIERHGGHMGFSSALGQGSTFWFTLPLARDQREG